MLSSTSLSIDINQTNRNWVNQPERRAESKFLNTVEFCAHALPGLLLLSDHELAFGFQSTNLCTELFGPLLLLSQTSQLLLDSLEVPENINSTI